MCAWRAREVILCFVCPSLAVIQVWNPSSSLPFTRLVFTVKLSNHKVMFYNVYRQIAPAAFSARWPCSLHTLGAQIQFCSFGAVLCFFFFLLYRLLKESTGWFSMPQPLFLVSFFPRISWIYIAFLSDFVYWSWVWPCGFLTWLCNTSQYNELQLPSSHYIVSYISIQLFHDVFIHSTCFALCVNMEG